MTVILLADGFEELEALTPLDVLRREAIDAVTVGINDRTVTGAHGIKVIADRLIDEIDPNAIDMLIFPGGMPGAINLDSWEHTDSLIDTVINNGGHLAAICAAPLVFGRRGLLVGKRATCFPGFEDELKGAYATGGEVETDGNITTARDFRAAIKFADELVKIHKQMRK